MGSDTILRSICQHFRAFRIDKFTYVPNHNCFWSPANAGLEVDTMTYVVVQELEQSFALLLLKANDATRNFREDS